METCDKHARSPIAGPPLAVRLTVSVHLSRKSLLLSLSTNLISKANLGTPFQPIQSYGTREAKRASKPLKGILCPYKKKGFAKSAKGITTNFCPSWQKRSTKKNSKVCKPVGLTENVHDETRKRKKKPNSLSRIRVTRRESPTKEGNLVRAPHPELPRTQTIEEKRQQTLFEATSHASTKYKERSH
nr:hypothetical protein [Tanacetum cinerariifolium]